MNIIILGAGQVGGTLAEMLVKEDNDVTVVDVDAGRLQSLQNRLDIRTIVGPGSQPHIMKRAGGEHTDMLIAVTSSDETNMIGCQVAYTLFKTPLKIARIRCHSYLAHPELFQTKALPIDVSIYPEHLVINHVQRLIEHPGALQVLDFANNKIQLIAITPHYRSPLVGQTLKKVHDFVPNIDMRVVAIFRGKQSIALTGETQIQIGDEVFFITATKQTKELLSALQRSASNYHNIIIGGGGHIGMGVAEKLEDHYNIKVIEHNERAAERAAERLTDSTVLLGDVCDRELLIDENIDATDVFCAVSNDDEANIMSCMQAKRLGARKAMALINRTTYVDLVEGSIIDVAISPQQATIGSILTYLRKGDVVNVHSLRRGAAEAIEIIVHGDQHSSKVVGRSLGKIKFPTGVTVGAIARGDKILIAHKELVVEDGDHLVLFLVDKKQIQDVEHLFQVNVSFFRH